MDALEKAPSGFGLFQYMCLGLALNGSKRPSTMSWLYMLKSTKKTRLVQSGLERFRAVSSKKN